MTWEDLGGLIILVVLVLLWVFGPGSKRWRRKHPRPASPPSPLPPLPPDPPIDVPDYETLTDGNLFTEAGRLLALGRDAEALPFALALTRRRADDPKAWMLTLTAEINLQRFASVETSAGNAAAFAGDDSKVLAAAGWALLMTGDLEQAGEIAARLDSTDGSAAWLLRLRLAWSKGNVEGMGEAVSTLHAVGISGPIIELAEADLALLDQDWEKAAAAYDRFSQARVAPKVAVRHAVALLEMRRYSMAMDRVISVPYSEAAAREVAGEVARLATRRRDIGGILVLVAGYLALAQWGDPDWLIVELLIGGILAVLWLTIRSPKSLQRRAATVGGRPTDKVDLDRICLSLMKQTAILG